MIEATISLCSSHDQDYHNADCVDCACFCTTRFYFRVCVSGLSPHEEPVPEQKFHPDLILAADSVQVPVEPEEPERLAEPELSMEQDLLPVADFLVRLRTLIPSSSGMQILLQL